MRHKVKRYISLIKQIILRVAKAIRRSRTYQIVAVVIVLALSLLVVMLIRYKHQFAVLKHPVNAITIHGEVSSPTSGITAQKGEELSWRKSISVSEEAQGLSGVIVEEIGDNQEFDGNVKLPPGWRIQYSCDAKGTPEQSRTYQDTPSCPINQVTYLKIITDQAETFQPYVQSAVTKRLDQLKLNNGTSTALPPIVFENKIFQIMQAVTVENAGSQDDFTINCFDLSTYATCSEVSFPTYFSTSVGKLGTGPKNINTPINMQSYLDDGSNGSLSDRGKLYFPGQSSNNYGVVCIDLISLSNCGFYSLGTSGVTYGGLANPVVLSGFVQEGSKLYGHANDADKNFQTVVCFNLNSDGNGLDAPCSDFSADSLASTPLYKIAEHGNNYFTMGNHIINGGKLYWLVNYSFRNIYALEAFPPAGSQRSFGTTITCFDIQTKAHCGGWPNVRGGVTLLATGGALYVGVERPTAIFNWYNIDGSVQAVCLAIGESVGVDPRIRCYNVTNGIAVADVVDVWSPSKNLPAQWLGINWTASPYVNEIVDVEGHKTYIPFYNTDDVQPTAPPSKGATICWNWTTQSVCNSGFSKTKYWHEINNGISGNMGYFYDGACMWGVDFSGDMWSFDTLTAEAPCRMVQSKQYMSVDISKFYCGDSQTIGSWNRLRLASADLYDFESFEVTVRNPAGNVVLKQGDLKSNSELDLSTISYSSYPQLKLDIRAKAYSTSPWANGNLPSVNLTTGGSSAQFCYKTKAKNYCDINEVVSTTKALVDVGIDNLSQTKPTTIGLNQPANEQCFKDVKVSISPDKTSLQSGNQVTYTVNVDSKANPNVYNRGNIEGATIEATIPTGFKFVSGDSGVQVDGGKAKWTNQTISAGTRLSRSFTLEAPTSYSYDTESSRGKVYAATTQYPINVQAKVIASDDIYQADNTSSSSPITLTIVSADPPQPTDTDNGTPDDTDETDGADNTDAQNEQEDIVPTQESTINTRQPSTSRPATTRGNSLVRTMLSPVNYVATSLKSVANKVPVKVAKALPYSSITLLIVFAVIYVVQTFLVIRNRRRLDDIKQRMLRVTKLKSDFLHLTAHYLNTPVTNMRLSVDSASGIQGLSQETVDKANLRIGNLNNHIESLLSSASVGLAESDSQMTVPKYSWFPKENFLPLLGILIITFIINFIFIGAGKYDPSSVNLLLQIVYYVLSAIIFIVVLKTFRDQLRISRYVEHEVATEKQLAENQEGFIANIYQVLNSDILELEQLTEVFANQSTANLFSKGLGDIRSTIIKFGYLNYLTVASTDSVLSPTDFNTVNQQVIEAINQFATERQVSLNINIANNLSLPLGEVEYKQLLYSLLHNAVKFNKQAGSVNLDITHRRRNGLNIRVADTGVGITKQALDYIFEPFGRGDDALEFNNEGFGIDLYMNKIIVERAGGTIDIKSTVDEGTQVDIFLPLR